MVAKKLRYIMIGVSILVLLALIFSFIGQNFF